MVFTSSYIQIQYITGNNSPFPCKDVKNGFLVTIIRVITNLVGWFGKLWSTCTRYLMPPLKKIVLVTHGVKSGHYVWNIHSNHLAMVFIHHLKIMDYKLLIHRF